MTPPLGIKLGLFSQLGGSIPITTTSATMRLNDNYFTVKTGSNFSITGSAGLNINQYAVFNYYASTTAETEFVIKGINSPGTGITIIQLTPEKSFDAYNTYPNDALVFRLSNVNDAKIYATGSVVGTAWTFADGGDLKFKVQTDGIVKVYDDGVLKYTSGEDFNDSHYYIGCNQLDHTAEIAGANVTGSLTLDSGYPAESSTSTLVNFGTNVTGSGLYAAGLAADGGYFSASNAATIVRSPQGITANGGYMEAIPGMNITGGRPKLSITTHSLDYAAGGQQANADVCWDLSTGTSYVREGGSYVFYAGYYPDVTAEIDAQGGRRNKFKLSTNSGGYVVASRNDVTLYTSAKNVSGSYGNSFPTNVSYVIDGGLWFGCFGQIKFWNGTD